MRLNREYTRSAATAAPRLFHRSNSDSRRMRAVLLGSKRSMAGSRSVAARSCCCTAQGRGRFAPPSLCPSMAVRPFFFVYER